MKRLLKSLSLQAELNEVLEDDEEQSPAPRVSVSPSAPPAAPPGATGLEARLLERVEMYKLAISNAKSTGESSKVRRYDRGLKVGGAVADVPLGRAVM